MNSSESYGVVYTPIELSDFVAHVAVDELTPSLITNREIVALDPACGEGVLLKSLHNVLSHTHSVKYVGVDIDAHAIKENTANAQLSDYLFFNKNTILPSSGEKASEYWKTVFSNVSIIIANPPWSSEKVFDSKALSAAGYCFDVGQYDSYVLFLELCLEIIEDDGIVAFIVPDSLFSGENSKLRRYLCENTEIRVIARLGEKIFPNVNRATSILVLRKRRPAEYAQTLCYRLDTAERKRFINGELDLLEAFRMKKHNIMQKRFLQNRNYVFDIDTYCEEESILSKIEETKITWEQEFHFGRGVEISKTGDIVVCYHCNKAQGYSKKQALVGKKNCQHCGAEISIDKPYLDCIIANHAKQRYIQMYVGENIRRYAFCGTKYILPDVDGINYKQASLYEPPKLLIRKTGLGINASIDYSSTYTSQTVYSCAFNDNSQTTPLEYYLGVLNSRLIYYYYLKKYGENEWKSHPYLTKDIIFSLPIKSVTTENRQLCMRIAEKAKHLLTAYTREDDIQLEKMIMKLYGISLTEFEYIRSELNHLPSLGAINHMKFTDGELCIDT